MEEGLQKKALYFFLVWFVFILSYALINHILSLAPSNKHILSGSLLMVFGIYNLYFLISMGIAKKSKILFIIFFVLGVLPILLGGLMTILSEFIGGEYQNFLLVGVLAIFISAFLIQFGLLFRLLHKKAE